MSQLVKCTSCARDDSSDEGTPDAATDANIAVLYGAFVTDASVHQDGSVVAAYGSPYFPDASDAGEDSGDASDGGA